MSEPNNLEGDPPTVEERAAMARELDAVAPTPGEKFALMLGQRPTPRTDEVRHVPCNFAMEPSAEGEWVPADDMQLVERELAEARSEIDQLKRERDNAETDRRQAESDTIRALHERNEARAWSSKLADLADARRADLADAREQRDRLAACLDHLREKDWFREGVTGREVVCGLDPDKVREALASLEGGADE